MLAVNNRQLYTYLMALLVFLWREEMIRTETLIRRIRDDAFSPGTEPDQLILDLTRDLVYSFRAKGVPINDSMYAGALDLLRSANNRLNSGENETEVRLHYYAGLYLLLDDKCQHICN